MSFLNDLATGKLPLSIWGGGTKGFECECLGNSGGLLFCIEWKDENSVKAVEAEFGIKKSWIFIKLGFRANLFKGCNSLSFVGVDVFNRSWKSFCNFDLDSLGISADDGSKRLTFFTNSMSSIISITLSICSFCYFWLLCYDSSVLLLIYSYCIVMIGVCSSSIVAILTCELEKVISDLGRTTTGKAFFLDFLMTMFLCDEFFSVLVLIMTSACFFLVWLLLGSKFNTLTCLGFAMCFDEFFCEFINFIFCYWFLFPKFDS